MKFSELENKMSARGFAPDSLAIDKILIESRRCPACKSRLEYQGFSGQIKYVAFGVCRSCNYAKRFWTESADFAAAKKTFSPAAVGK